ncbi:Predicted PurR-regulated permease PerM [Nocardioides alpinus]|uniref:Predicted PurR-regulated permease PerM n=1 Tax=Nocardioides alpinus TaxID=748909 RepID=A0A1I0VPV4_9ACTN|nr:AI-2E family transporter [Nocardioides alpinus]SFA78067.1 Predicted PurR-regulated permease PerM [Nocardioides alpinus]
MSDNQAPDLDDESTRRRLFPPLGRTEDDDRLTERIVAQWAQVRAERRAEPAFTTGPSNFSRAQVPWGLDLAAAWSWRLIVIVVAALGLLWTMRYFAVITLPLAIALLGAALAIPLVHGLRRVGLPRGPSAGIVMVLGISTVALLLTFVGQQVAQGATDLADSVVTGLDQVREWLRTGPLGISDSQLDGYIKEVQSAITDSTGTDGVVTRVTEVGTAVGHVVAGFFIVLFSTYFFLADGDRIWAWMVRLAPRAARERVDASGRVAWVSLTQFVRATVLVALADAIGIMLVAFFLGVPFVFALGVLVFLGAFVPMIGATVAGTVAILVALVDQGPWTALLMLGGVILVQQIEGHILQPFLMGRFVSLHPLGVIVAIGCGVLVAGIAGALIAVPLAAAGNAVAQHLATYTGVGDDAEEALVDDLATDGVPPDEVPPNDSPVGESAERDPHPDHTDDLSTLKDDS